MIDHGVEGDRLAIAFLAAFGRAEIDAAGELAHAEDVKATGDEVLSDGRGVGEGGQTDTGTEIGEEAEVLAQRQQRTALGLDVGWQGLPFRPADGTEEDGIRRLAGGDGFRR